MADFVELHLLRNRGWPWPEESWGLTPMYGEDGWCRSCGTPRRAQTGSLVLQRRGLTRVEGVWMPNWQFNALCLGADLAATVAAAFPGLDLRPVEFPRTAAADGVQQIVAPITLEPWFGPAELRVATTARHGSAGRTCSDCGTWRWYPLGFGALPPLRIDLGTLLDQPIVASPEWFGDGWNSFHELLVRRDLAEVLATASPRDFRVSEVR